jgi:uncharacterized protein
VKARGGRRCEDPGVSDAQIELAFAAIADEVVALRPPGVVVDAHTHLGLDEDGRSLDPASLLAALDDVGADARACVFPLHDPERHPAYRLPNDRVLAWARESGGRLVPFCRLDPREEPVAEAERCLALGAQGIKLHPRAQAFGFDDPAAVGIFEVAREAGIPILIHAGRGMGPMDALAGLALRFPEVPLVLAHAAIADQGMFASRLADHPAVVYDTSCFAALDVVELFARVPAERIVFASDIPYGRPVPALHLALRVAAYAGLDEQERALVAGGTMAALVERRPLVPATAPRVRQERAVSGRLLRVSGYIATAFGAIVGAGPPRELTRGLPHLHLARAACRDPEPGAAGPALERIDVLLAAAERLIGDGTGEEMNAYALIIAAGAIAATEPVA